MQYTYTPYWYITKNIISYAKDFILSRTDDGNSEPKNSNRRLNPPWSLKMKSNAKGVCLGMTTWNMLTTYNKSIMNITHEVSPTKAFAMLQKGALLVAVREPKEVANKSFDVSNIALIPFREL